MNLSSGARLTPEALTDAAREAFGASGLTQQQAAERLGVSRPALAQAVGDPRRSLDALRRRIVEAFTAFRVEGPEYRLVPKDSGATGNPDDAAAPGSVEA